MCDHGSTQNKVRTIFCKNSFLNRKLVFLKIVFSKLDFENDKENSLELFIKHFRNMKDVRVCVCARVSIQKELSTYIILVLTNDYKSYLKCKKQKYKSWYSLLFQSWSLSSFMCLGSGIYIFLASKHVNLMMEPKCNKKLTWNFVKQDC